MIKSLILDVDGVLLTNKILENHVRANCVRYVRSKVPGLLNPDMTNTRLYARFGHTAVGLSTVFKVDTSDFNEKVYTPELMEHLHLILSGNTFKIKAEKIQKFKENRWNVQLLSNAPHIWVKAVADILDVEYTYSRRKPSPSAYTGFSTTQTHIFIDDSLKNLEGARNIPNWHPYLLSESKETVWCPTLTELPEYNFLPF